jgi:hypothetical protein
MKCIKCNGEYSRPALCDSCIKSLHSTEPVIGTAKIDGALKILTEKAVLLDMCAWVTRQKFEDEGKKFTFMIGQFARSRFYDDD